VRLNIFCENRSSRAEDRLASSMRSTEWRSLYHQKGGTAFPADHPTPLDPRPQTPRLPPRPAIEGGYRRGSQCPGIEEVMPWGVFAAYAAALASTGFLFVMTLTGGIYLG
jgi:hypothetical protein